MSTARKPVHNLLHEWLVSHLKSRTCSTAFIIFKLIAWVMIRVIPSTKHSRTTWDGPGWAAGRRVWSWLVVSVHQHLRLTATTAFIGWTWRCLPLYGEGHRREMSYLGHSSSSSSTDYCPKLYYFLYFTEYLQAYFWVRVALLWRCADGIAGFSSL